MAFGEHLNAPVVGVSSAALYPWLNDIVANPHNLAFVQNNLLNYIESLDFFSRVYNVIHTAANKLAFDLFTTDQDFLVKEYFGANTSGVRELLESKVALIIAKSHATLTGNRPVVLALVEVAGLHVYDENDQQLSSVR